MVCVTQLLCYMHPTRPNHNLESQYADNSNPNDESLNTHYTIPHLYKLLQYLPASYPRMTLRIRIRIRIRIGIGITITIRITIRIRVRVTIWDSKSPVEYPNCIRSYKTGFRHINRHSTNIALHVRRRS